MTEPDKALLFADIHGVNGGAKPRQEPVQRIGEPEISFLILDLLDNGLQFTMKDLFLTA